MLLNFQASVIQQNAIRSEYFEETSYVCTYALNMHWHNRMSVIQCTEYAALELVYRIINHMDKNEVPINICLDLSKAITFYYIN